MKLIKLNSSCEYLQQLKEKEDMGLLLPTLHISSNTRHSTGCGKPRITLSCSKREFEEISTTGYFKEPFLSF